MSSQERNAGWRVFWLLTGILPLGFLTIFFAWPAANLIASGFHGDAGWGIGNFTEILKSRRTWRIVGFTLGISTVATLVCVLLGLPGAHLLHRRRFRGQRWVRALVMVPFVLPTVVVGVAFGSLLDATGPFGFLGLDDHPGAILLAMVFFNYAVVVRTVGTMWRRLDPGLTEAARTLGASRWRAFATVTLPALLPAIAAAASLAFLFCASSFGIVMVLGGVRWATIETEIWYRTTQLLDLQAAAALSVIQLLIVTVLLLLTNALQRKGQQARRLSLDNSDLAPVCPRRDWASLTVTGGVVVLLLCVPLLNLLLRSLRRGGQWTLANYAGLWPTPGATTAVPATRALWNSLWIAIVAAVIALLLGVMVSLIASRRPTSGRRRRFLWGLEGLFLLPLGVSAVTVGFGYLITLNRPPLDLRSSLVLIPIAQALVALPLVVRSLLPSLRALDVRQLEAAQTLGASPWRILHSIEFPQLFGGIGLAAGFAFATSLGEFGATSFLSRPDNPTLPVMIFRLFSRPGADNYGTAMAAATLLALVTAIVMASSDRGGAKGLNLW